MNDPPVPREAHYSPAYIICFAIAFGARTLLPLTRTHLPDRCVENFGSLGVFTHTAILSMLLKSLLNQSTPESPFVTRSMPHAESSSFPRGTRTVQITPRSMSLAWKAWTAAGGDGKKRRPAAPSPAFALYGMRLMRVLPGYPRLRLQRDEWGCGAG